jgi:hypothetical protein
MNYLETGRDGGIGRRAGLRILSDPPANPRRITNPFCFQQNYLLVFADDSCILLFHAHES